MTKHKLHVQRHKHHGKRTVPPPPVVAIESEQREEPTIEQLTAFVLEVIDSEPAQQIIAGNIVAFLGKTKLTSIKKVQKLKADEAAIPEGVADIE